MDLQKFADESHLDITVCHFPPGMSKWNKIEHRMFSYITMNWRGKPLRSYKTIIELIGNTRKKWVEDIRGY
ncbi:Transposase, Rhodopirellula-type [mine drainage metagenome]|uniref:Transposase, Rhodopirellula-type n=1 Tax=mine drainage metagenome TaxID=410659 RepID=T1A509_9ZZZZ